MTQSFYEQLLAETAEAAQSFRAIPVIRRTVAQGADRGLYLKFLASAYHHVRHTCPLLERAHGRCTEADHAYKTGLLAYLDEEQGHEAWILEDIAALGGDAAAVAAALPPLPVRLMVAYGYYAIDHISPYALLGMVHVLEGMSVALSHAAAGAIRASLRLDEKTPGFSYLTSHGALDVEHVDLFAALLERIDTPERRRVVIQAARDFYRLYGDIFRALDDEGDAKNAA